MSVRELLVELVFLRIGIVGLCCVAFAAGAGVGFVVVAIGVRDHQRRGGDDD